MHGIIMKKHDKHVADLSKMQSEFPPVDVTAVDDKLCVAWQQGEDGTQVESFFMTDKFTKTSHPKQIK